MATMSRNPERPNEPVGGRPYRQQTPAVPQRSAQRLPFFIKYDIPRRCAGIVSCVQAGFSSSAGNESNAQKIAKQLSDNFSEFFQETENLTILIVCSLFQQFPSFYFILS